MGCNSGLPKIIEESGARHLEMIEDWPLIPTGRGTSCNLFEAKTDKIKVLAKATIIKRLAKRCDIHPTSRGAKGSVSDIKMNQRLLLLKIDVL